MKRPPTTRVRAQAAQAAVNAHAAKRRTPCTARATDKIDDLLLDLRFLCRKRRVSFTNAVARSDAAYIRWLFPGDTLKRLYPPENGGAS